MLRRLKIERFKTIENFDEELDAVTVLVGTNNSGKTSVLNAIHTSVALAQSRRRLFGVKAVEMNGAAVSINVSDVLYMPSVEPKWLANKGNLSAESGPKISFFFDGQSAAEGVVEIFAAEGRNLSVKLTGESVISRIEKIDEPFSIYVPGLAGIARTEGFLSRGSLLRAVARGDANLVLRNVLSLLKEEASKWTRFSLALAEVYPDHEIKIEFNQDIDEHIMVTVVKGGQVIPIDCIGTGFLQAAQILSYVFLFEPVITLLDEPDSHLHPNNQRILATLLSRLATEGRTKIIMATHSRHIVDAMRGKQAIKIKWMRGGSVVPVTSHLPLLADLGAFDSAEGLLANQIDFVVLTEDEDKGPITLLFEANGAPKGRFQVWAYKGCAKLDVAEALAQFIKEVSPMTSMIVHRDSDFFDDADKEFIRSQFRDYGIDVFLPPTPDPEGFICGIDHVKHLNPGREALVQAAFDQAIALDAERLRAAAKSGREELDIRRHKLRQATQGEAAIRKWANELDLSSPRWRHGKMFRGAVRKYYQETTGLSLKMDEISPHLKIIELEDWIKKAIGALAPTPAPAQAAGVSFPTLIT